MAVTVQVHSSPAPTSRRPRRLRRSRRPRQISRGGEERGSAARRQESSRRSPHTEAIRLDGGNGLLWGNRSAAHLQAQQPEAALADAEKMVDLLPSLAKAHFRLGNAHDGCGERAAAATAYLEALRLEPANDALAGAVQRSSDALKKDPEHAALCARRRGARRARGGGEAAQRRAATIGERGGRRRRGAGQARQRDAHRTGGGSSSRRRQPQWRRPRRRMRPRPLAAAPPDSEPFRRGRPRRRGRRRRRARGFGGQQRRRTSCAATPSARGRWRRGAVEAVRRAGRRPRATATR